MSAERVERRLTAVLATDVEGCPNGGRIAVWQKRLVYMCVAAVVVLVVSIGETAAQPKSGVAGAAWSREIRNELSRQSPWPLNIQEQSLATAQDGNDAADAEFVKYLAALYAQPPPDLIVALGAPAARFVEQHRTDLFPRTPMLLPGAAGTHPGRVARLVCLC